MYLLLALSVASIGAMVERWLYFRKRGLDGEELGDTLCALLEEGHDAKADALLRASPSVEAEVLLASLRWAKSGPQALESAIDGEMIKRRRELERSMTLLGTLGNNAPFVGLLGTVIGVIVAFADLADGQNKVQMDKVMGGIAEALVATGVGLFVAIPAVVAYNVFQKKHRRDRGQRLLDLEASLCLRLSARRGLTTARAHPHDAMPKSVADGVRELGRLESGNGAVTAEGVRPWPASVRSAGEAAQRHRRDQRDADGRCHAGPPRHHDGGGHVHRVPGAQGGAAEERRVG